MGNYASIPMMMPGGTPRADAVQDPPEPVVARRPDEPPRPTEESFFIQGQHNLVNCSIVTGWWLTSTCGMWISGPGSTGSGTYSRSRNLDRPEEITVLGESNFFLMDCTKAPRPSVIPRIWLSGKNNSVLIILAAEPSANTKPEITLKGRGNSVKIIVPGWPIKEFSAYASGLWGPTDGVTIDEEEEIPDNDVVVGANGGRARRG